MAENAFLTAVSTFLRDRAGLSPAPARVGFAEPAAADELPAVVLSLEEVQRLGGGIGERSQLMTGALAWREEIDLADPMLAGEPALDLVSSDRRRLTLPHGGLVRRDGSPGPLAGADLRVTVDGAPAALQAEPEIGRLTFADPLPITGTVAAEYFLGQWERSVVRLYGVLRADACAATAAQAEGLSAGMVAALVSPAARPAIQRLESLGVLSLGSIGAAEPLAAGARRRTARFQFEFEHIVDRPESSGGVLQAIHVGLKGLAADPEAVIFVDEIRRRRT
ncbi:MAG TPA: hypothetical protein VMW27_17925 [Thermoanaerobaculia bacterium]|nr:hypothetical protein [Thermoanaerobaculia bacterium]